ncbi:MAG: nuclear transport factor 2 family protein [Candidatus Binatia bacterium]
MAQKGAKAAKSKTKVRKATAHTVALVGRKKATKTKSTLLRASTVTASSLVEDYIGILQLLHKYCHAVDRGTADEVTALFHTEAVLLPKYESDERYEGREAVRGWYQRYIENFRAKVRYLRHKIEAPVIYVMGNEATCVCYLDADSITIAKNQANVACGRYDDKFIKESGQWWFKERAIVAYYSYPLPSYRPGRGE